MKLTHDIQSLSTFKRDTAKLVRPIEENWATGSSNGKGKAELVHLGVIEQIDQILRETNFNPRNLKLEITEGSVMENAAAVPCF